VTSAEYGLSLGLGYPSFRPRSDRYREIGEVNRKLPDEKQISYSFMYPGKMQKIKAKYHRLYPTGRVDAWRSTFQIGLFVFLALAAITSGFFK
jgi:hypothetical protein